MRREVYDWREKRRSMRSLVVEAVLLAALIALFSLVSVAAAADETRRTDVVQPGRIALPEGFRYPNGIARAADGTLYVGSVVSGTILIKPAGSDAWQVFFSGSEAVFAATTLRLDEARGVLWGASPDFLGLRQPDGSVLRRPHRLFALDLRTRATRTILLMPDGGFGNDIAVDPQGGLYVTDSARARILSLAPGSDQFTTVIADPRFAAAGQGIAGVGPAGIALTPDGSTLVIGTYGPGRLFLVQLRRDEGPIVSELSLARPLQNPDGMRFFDDRHLLVVEGAVESGDGRLVAIDVLSPGTAPRVVETLARGLDMPVNIATGAGAQVWLTESRLRHRLTPDGTQQPPDAFWVTQLDLSSTRQR